MMIGIFIVLITYFFTPIFQPNAILFPLVLALKGYWWFLILPVVGLFLWRKNLITWAKFRARMIPVDELKKWNWKKLR